MLQLRMMIREEAKAIEEESLESAVLTFQPLEPRALEEGSSQSRR